MSEHRHPDLEQHTNPVSFNLQYALMPNDAEQEIHESMTKQLGYSKLVSRFIAGLDKGAGLHSGGYIDPAERQPGFATGTEQYAGNKSWDRFAGIEGAKNLLREVTKLDDEVDVASRDLEIPEKMSLLEARDLVVLSMLGSQAQVAPRVTEQYTAQNMTQGDPRVLVGSADVQTLQRRFVLEVATAFEEDEPVSFCISRRNWTSGKLEPAA